MTPEIVQAQNHPTLDIRYKFLSPLYQRTFYFHSEIVSEAFSMKDCRIHLPQYQHKEYHKAQYKC